MRHALPFGFVVWLLISLSSIACGYEVETHKEISQKAVEASVLAKDPGLLPNLGLQPLSKKEKFPNSNADNQDIVNLFRDGANFEDNNKRPLNHFFDPARNMALTVGITLGETSPDWALEDNGNITEQTFSYRDAR